MSTLSVAILGDMGHDNDMKRRILRGVNASRDVSFAVGLGDNFYPAGVSGPDDPLWSSHFFDLLDANPAQR